MAGCPNRKGFPTLNDLERHKHAKHGIDPPEGRPKFKDWICKVPNCPKAGHIFNRQDNFKAHLVRMHPEVELDHYLQLGEHSKLTHQHSKNSMQPPGERPNRGAFMCREPDCPKGNHVFNMWENFKAHLIQMHPEVKNELYA